MSSFWPRIAPGHELIKVDEYTEELLQAHEEYVELLRAEIESKAAILPRVREWHALVAEEEELERSASDPNRFKMRGGALLKEEKMRKRVEHLKPKVRQLSVLSHWQEPKADCPNRSRPNCSDSFRPGKRKRAERS